MSNKELQIAALDDLPGPSSDEAKKLFEVDTLQSLNPDSICRCQSLLGHGKEYGVWATSEKVIGYRVVPAHSRLIIRDSIIRHIPVDVSVTEKLLELLNEAELWLSRYALLLRIGQSSLRRNQLSLQPSTIIRILYKSMPPLLVAGILERLSNDTCVGLLSCLKPEALAVFRRREETSQELNRLDKFYDMGLWSDIPRRESIKNITNPAGDERPPPREDVSNPYLPLSDSYMVTMGPRALWVVQILGPEILKLCEPVEKLLQGDGCLATRRRDVADYFRRKEWIYPDSYNPWKPPFDSADYNCKTDELNTRFLKFGDFRPTSWADMVGLFVLLQASHFWIALLATAGRVGEILNLQKACIEKMKDGEFYLSGKTYKLSDSLFGEEREWPAPDILVEALVQQAELLRVYENLVRAQLDGADMMNFGNGLWISIGSGKLAESSKYIFNVNHALKKMAERLGVELIISDNNIHAHRFRKTIARLVALTIVDGPRVLMRLLGHKDISMTLSYMLSDKGLQAEIDTVARELRILRCKEVVTDIHDGLHDSNPFLYSGYGGGAMPALQEAVINHEAKLKDSNHSWSDETAQELATVLTFNGQNYKLVKPGVICIKPSRDFIPCACNSDCVNRIEHKTARRDVEVLIPLLVENAKQSIADKQFLVAESFLKQLEDEMLRFHDIGDPWQKHADVLYIRTCLEE